MKKILFVTMLFCSFLSITASAQIAQYKVSNPHSVIPAGGYSQPAQYSPVSAVGAPETFPWYTKTDTVINTAVDTFKGKLIGPQESVYTWVHVTGISGTNTSCTAKLWVSADSSAGVDFIPIQTFTVSATNPVGFYLWTGWPYTNWFWTFTGSGTQESSWYSGLYVK